MTIRERRGELRGSRCVCPVYLTSGELLVCDQVPEIGIPLRDVYSALCTGHITIRPLCTYEYKQIHIDIRLYVRVENRASYVVC